MSAWKPKKGTREIDRVFPSIGRVRLRTGTHDARRAEAYDRMLDDLPLDVIRLLQAKILTLRELYDLRLGGKPMPTADELSPLLPAIDAWLESPLRPVGTQEERARRAWKAEIVLLAQSRAGVSQLPTYSKALYVRHRDAGQAAAWNRRKAIALAFIRDTLGKSSPVHAALRELPTLPEPPKFPRHQCTVAEARDIAVALGPKWGPQWWTLCITGMEPKEHWTDGWQVIRGGVEIHGQKRPARERVVPLIGKLSAPVGKQGGFSEALDRAELGVTPMDARRSYTRWLDEIGLPHYRQDAYTGPGPKSMRALYKWGDISSWLAEDTKRLRAYLGEPLLQVEQA